VPHTTTLGITSSEHVDLIGQDTNVARPADNKHAVSGLGKISRELQMMAEGLEEERERLANERHQLGVDRAAKESLPPRNAIS